MSAKVAPTDLPTHAFPTAYAFSSFLDTHSTTCPGLYLKLAKKSSGTTSIAASEAVEVALCYGWIDGRANGIDDKWWTVRYTPRRKKSIWSKKNVDTVGRLIEEGKMREGGMRCVEEAKEDGRWERAYAGPASIEVPADLAQALEVESKAKDFFEGLNRGDRYSVLWRIETASPNARAGRIEAIMGMLRQGIVPGKEEQAKWKPKKTAKVKKDGVVKKEKTKKTPMKRRTEVANKAVADMAQGKTVTEQNHSQSRRPGLRART